MIQIMLLINRVLSNIKATIVSKILWESGTLHKISNLESETNSYKQIFSNSIFNESSELMELNKILKPKKSSVELIRIGSKLDGGYICPTDFKDTEILLSFGLGDNVTFEKMYLKQTGKKVIGFDPYVNEIKIKNFTHKLAKVVGTSPSLENRNSSLPELDINSIILSANSQNILLKIDIEGDEYDVIDGLELALLDNVRILVVEFHNISIKYLYGNGKKIFDKLLSRFEIVHLHANNSVGLARLLETPFFNTVEITFVNKKQYLTTISDKPFYGPTTLDLPNNKYVKEHNFMLQ